jgi:hypothetical protein
MSIFFLIPTSEITQGMINRSTSLSIDTIPTTTINYIPFYILEVEKQNVLSTNIFDNYVPYLKNQIEYATPKVVAQSIRFKGIFKDTVSPYTTKETSYTFIDNKIITGVVFRTNNFNFGDNVSIIIKDPMDNIINTFVSDWYIEDSLFQLEVPRTLIVANIKICLLYKNIGANTANWFMNLKLWEP